MRRPVDSLFGRLALLVVSVLLICHLAWFFAIRHEHTQTQVRYAVEETTFLIESVRLHAQHQPDTPLPPSVHVVPVGASSVPATGANLPEPVARFITNLADRLPAGTEIRPEPPQRPTVGKRPAPPSVWVREPGDADWVVVPLRAMRPPPSADRMAWWLAMIFSAGVIAALIAAWQLQEPLRLLARAVERFGRGQAVPPLSEKGPRELRQLTRGFNQMVTEVAQADSDRGVMLAGVAHDLRTPLARMRLRAEMLDDDKLRDGIVRDVDSMSHIVDQFLVFANGGVDRSEVVSVDETCERIARTYRAVMPNAPAVRAELAAGDGFRLPTATLERILSNLLDNAHAYGAPPVIIGTRRAHAIYELTVTDHGRGIAPRDLADATRPFVRLDPARGGNGHSGLGLAIVERLAKRLGGECEIANRPEGGLYVTLRFPFDALARRDEAEAAA